LLIFTRFRVGERRAGIVGAGCMTEQAAPGPDLPVTIMPRQTE
jgi:hypothetical protein